MVLEILCVEHVYSQHSGVLQTCLALRYRFFEVLGSESFKVLLSLYNCFVSFLYLDLFVLADDIWIS